MPTQNRRKKPTAKVGAIAISHNVQIAFIVVTLLGWLSWLAFYLMWATGTYFSFGTWVYQITQTVFPFLWFSAALWFCWNRYATVLHRVFAATLIASVGVALFQMLSVLENQLRFRFYPPGISTTKPDNSLFTAFGHDWLVMGIGLGLFIGIIVWRKYRTRKVR